MLKRTSFVTDCRLLNCVDGPSLPYDGLRKNTDAIEETTTVYVCVRPMSCGNAEMNEISDHSTFSRLRIWRDLAGQGEN